MPQVVESKGFGYLQANRVQQVKTVTHRSNEPQRQGFEHFGRKGTGGKHQETDQGPHQIVEIPG
ncbi:MAG: hypothetical protein ACD_75C00222G0001 [uncultured bacterium]|nr:MAG: hypothetical protein ACD_75C00222G0001 [uncultured bacterium]